jgi:parvulin-like peptidyl-prolyl isomerase
MRNTPPPPRRVRSAHESRSATVRAAAAAPSKRQLSHWQREQSHQRMLFIGIGALLTVIVAIFIGAIIYDRVVRANDVVAQIGSTTVTTSDLAEAMGPNARQIDARARQQGNSANAVRQAEQEKRSLPDSVLNELIDKHLIQQEAERLGVSVADTEREDRLRQFVADFNVAMNPSPTSVPTSTPEAAAAPTAVGTPTPIPTPTTVPTLDSAAYPAALQQFLDRNFYTEADFRTVLNDFLLREKVAEAFGEEQVPANQEQVHARHILVSSGTDANDVLQQLEAGADFATLAQARSTDPGSKAAGGDLGWFSRGVMDSTFESAAFALQPGQRSAVVQTSNGYHLIELLERDPNRPLPETQLESLRQKAFTEWLNRRRSNPDVALQLSTGERDWALSRLGVRP